MTETDSTPPIRPGEVRLGDAAGEADAPRLAVIGRIRSPWSKGNGPKNLCEARDRGGDFVVEVDPAYRAGLRGLVVGDAIILMYWMNAARRDLIVQFPSHRNEPTGTFALRSPARPNPIALGVVRVLELDEIAGRLLIDAIDAYDETPVLDIKPWLASTDIPPPVAF